MGFKMELINIRETARKTVKQIKLVFLNSDPFMDQKNGRKRARKRED